MMKPIAIQMSVMMMLASAAFADSTYPMDAEFGKHEVELRALNADCVKSEKNIARRMKCEELARGGIQTKYLMRGTYSYFLVNYSQMTRPELKTKKDELFTALRIARSRKDFMKDTDRPPGELTKEVLQAEIDSIDGEVSQRAMSGCGRIVTAADAARCEASVIKDMNEHRKTTENDPHYPDLLKKLGQ